MADRINDNAKLQSFARYVTSDAAKKRASLEKQLNEKWNQMVDETELALYKQAYEKIQSCRATLSRATNEMLSREKLACKRNLSARRGEITDAVMEEVRGRITAFTKSADYYPWLFKAAKAAVDSLGEGAVILYLNGMDAALAKKLAAELGAQVELLDKTHDVIGGVKAINTDTHTAVNRTLAFLLETQQEEFLKISDLSI